MDAQTPEAKNRPNKQQASPKREATSTAEEAVPRISTGGGAYVAGGVTVTGDFVGRDQITYSGYTPEQVSELLEAISTTFQPKPFDGRCPYVGLETFNERDADRFFGRQRVVTELLSRLKEAHFVVVAGPSGSGKSSLVRAGLIPTLRKGELSGSDNWLYESLKPGRDPLDELGRVVERFAGNLQAGDDIRAKGATDHTLLYRWTNVALGDDDSRRAVILVDQFEEIFTQISPDREPERVAFLNLLTYAATVDKARVIILLTIRSDFISNCATYPQLNDLLNQQFIQVGAMQPDELVRAIALPALQVGLRIDPDLVAQIVKDMGDEPGALPLMQFALKDLFDAQQAKGGVIALSLADYLQRGGIRKALERHADAVLERLNEQERILARAVFSGLIQVGRGAQDTSRTATFAELIPANIDAANVQSVIRKLADARLITTDERGDQDTATISHERLIEAWPWLQRLVNENRDIIALQNEINEDASRWNANQKDASYLYTGARLATVQEQLTARKLTLSGLSQAFVQTGIDAQELAKKQEEERRQHEIEQARKLADERQKRAEEQEAAAIRIQRRARIAIGIGIVAIVLATVAGFLFFEANRNALAAQQGNSRSLAAQAEYLKDTDLDLALLLAVEAAHVANTMEAKASLLSVATAKPGLLAFLPRHNDIVLDVGFSPDGRMAASVGDIDGSIDLWDVSNRAPLKTLIGPPQQVRRIAWHPQQPLLASGDLAGNVILWDLSNETVMSRTLYTHPGSVSSLAFSPDGRFLATGGCATPDWSSGDFCESGEIWRWDFAFQRPITPVLSSPIDSVDALAFSQDGRLLASGSCAKRDERYHNCNQGEIRLWDIEQGWSPTQVLAGHADAILSLAFNPRNANVLVSSGLGGIIVWDIAQGQRLGEYADPNNFIHSLRFSPDGNRLFSSRCGSFRTSYIYNPACVQGTILVWDYPGDRPTSILRELNGHTDWVNGIAVAPDGHTLLSGGRDRRLILWESEVSQELGKVALRQDVGVYDVAISPDDHLLAVGACTKMAEDGFHCLEGEVQLRNLITDSAAGVLHAPMGAVQSVAFSPDAKTNLLATGGCSALDEEGNCQAGEIRLWDPVQQRLVGDPLQGHTNSIHELAFSPDGSKLASGGDDGYVMLWDVAARRPLTSPLFADGNFVTSVAFNADGSLLAASGGDSFITLWDASTGQQIDKFQLKNSTGVVVVAFSPDSTRNLLVSGGKFRHPPMLWDLENAKPQALSNIGRPVEALAFNRDGTMLATTNLEGVVTLWDMTTRQPIGDLTIDPQLAPASHLLFDSSGKRLAANTATAVIVWDVDAKIWEKQACRRANRKGFSDAEWGKYFGSASPHPVCE